MSMRGQFLLLIWVCVSVLGNSQSNGQTICELAAGILDLTGIGLTSLPENFVKNQYLTNLTLAGNTIQQISSKTFSSVPNLSILSLENNSLTSLKLEQFSTLRKLETLVLDGNCKPSRKPEQQLVGSDNYGNDEFEIEEVTSPLAGSPCDLHIDAELPSLKSLHVERNHIQKIVATDTGKLPSLTHMYLSHNSISMTKETTRALKEIAPSVTNLYMKKCEIREIDTSELSTVMSLELDDNQICTICNRYCAGSSLILQKAERLENLTISGNRISQIESDAFNFTTNLKKLDLSKNQLKAIRDGTFYNLNKLEYLSFEENHITSLNEVHTLNGLFSLEYLSFAKNDITHVSVGVFDQMSELKMLNMDHNRLSVIENELFSKLFSLEGLSLVGNELSSIHLSSLQSITTLNLDYNMFVNITSISLENITNISTLSLKDNPLETITTDWLRNQSQSLSVNIKRTCTSERYESFEEYSSLQQVVE